MPAKAKSWEPPVPRLQESPRAGRPEQTSPLARQRCAGTLRMAAGGAGLGPSLLVGWQGLAWLLAPLSGEAMWVIVMLT